ncbi:MAG: hypothetical protein IT357_16285 [Gemmatimonadaceae bacterium]|nr:hypothetical protein [Gemmatimonadaceae bacterium]
MSAMRWAAAVLMLVTMASPAQAQLVSPGKLSAAHAQLDGMTNCTKCHDLGKRGASDTKCLGCHTTIRTRIEAKEGLHATYTGKSCASCHKDHFGADFAVVRFDTARFDHKKGTGYELRLGHLEPGCRDCHKESLIADPAVRRYATEQKIFSKTYLGLPTGCVDCHRVDNVHGEQFGTRKCTACHTEKTWEEAPLFSHDSTDYVLTGAHRDVKCEGCHKERTVPGMPKPVTQYANVKAGTCQTCHVDPHQGRMRQTCQSCHNTESWTRLTNRNAFESSFDHARTKFKLVGAHAHSQCAACHNPTARPSAGVKIAFAAGQAKAMYPAPRTTNGCASCHVDVHEGTFAKSPGGPACQNCHGENTWLPASYDLARHNRESYVLTGAHVAVACISCHKPTREGGPPQFKLPSRDCISCHREADPHGGQFVGRACTECHSTDSFKVPSFDHAKTRYPLDGAHKDVACAKCHSVIATPNGSTMTRYRPLEMTCKACHGAAIPRRS